MGCRTGRDERAAVVDSGDRLVHRLPYSRCPPGMQSRGLLHHVQRKRNRLLQDDGSVQLMRKWVLIILVALLVVGVLTGVFLGHGSGGGSGGRAGRAVE